jgi:hypothetical protein
LSVAINEILIPEMWEEILLCQSGCHLSLLQIIFDFEKEQLGLL